MTFGCGFMIASPPRACLFEMQQPCPRDAPTSKGVAMRAGQVATRRRLAVRAKGLAGGVGIEEFLEPGDPIALEGDQVDEIRVVGPARRFGEAFRMTDDG